MKKYLYHPIIQLDKDTYLTLIVFLAPFMNFLSGINIDIYSPSMPSIVSYFNATIIATKNTISVTVLGWTIGAIFFGILIDSIGRKKILVYGILFYVIASMSARWCSTIHQLMIVRFIQGFMISTISVGSRALILDNITGERYAIAILYTSIGYGLGPLIGPFIGGILQHYFGWQANFIALAIFAVILLFVSVFFIEESIPQKQPLILRQVTKKCIAVLRHRKFIAGVIIGGLIQIQIMLYPTLGPFIVENILHRSVLVYGNTALAVGGSYLVGTLINRALLKYILPKQVCYVGFVVLLMGLLVSYLFAEIWVINLATVMIPIILFCVGAGLIYANVLGTNLKQFPNDAGIAMAILISLLLLVAAIGIFIISHIHIVGLFQLSIIFSVLVFLEILIFFSSYRSLFNLELGSSQG